MSAVDTWDAITEDPPAESETSEAVVDELPAEAEAQTTDVVEPPSSDDPAREAEAEETVETEEEPKVEEPKAEVQTDDPAELEALPPGARAWARRRDRDARLVDDFLNPEVPASKVADRLSEKSPSRYNELVTDFFETHGPDYLKKTFGMSAEEIQAKLTAEPHTSTDSPDDDPDYDVFQDPLVPDSVKASLREAQELKAKFGDVEKKVNAFETKEQEREREARETQARTMGFELRDSVWSVVPAGIKEYGLEVSDDDPEDIAGLKEAAAYILENEVEPTFDLDEDNKKAVLRASEFIARLERENAFREEDPLKVRARAALEQVKSNDRRVKSIIRAIEQLSEKKAQKLASRGKSAPPVPSSPSGGTAVSRQAPSTWDEAEQMR
jgi:hypothetical protein